MNQEEIKEIKETAEEFLQKMTLPAQRVDVKLSEDTVEIDVTLPEPQILIGEKGQTLTEMQRLLKIILNKKLEKIFYLNVDINEYKKKKIEYLKDLARDLADEVALTKENKILHPMPAYERRIIHAEISQRSDVDSESQGEGEERCVVIKPRI